MLSSHQQPLILASTSVFRKQLLARLGLSFDTIAPDVDETVRPEETAQQLVLRLAEAKARAAAQQASDALIIGSDQVACLDDQILGKPGNRDRAIEQLQQSAGKQVVFYTGLCLLNAAKNRCQLVCEPFRVKFRPLSRKQIEGYLDREQPYQCAGSFRSEGLGIALFERLEGDDPNTLIGLPLIQLVKMLEQEGLAVI